MIIRNEDIEEVRVEIPEGHRHIRTTIRIRDGGGEFTLQEAAVAAILRAYVDVKNHPTRTGIVLRAMEIETPKPGYARWQLMECGE